MNNQEYIYLSLVNNMFFTRIMKEHAIFLNIALPEGNYQLKNEINNFEQEFSKMLYQTIIMSNYQLDNKNEQFVTNFTKRAEELTEKYTHFGINQTITDMQLKLINNQSHHYDLQLIENLKLLNNHILILLQQFISFQKKVVNATNSCQLFTNIYPSMMEHQIEETQKYYDIIHYLEQRIDINKISLTENEHFWNHIMMEHAQFLKGLLDPAEKELIDITNEFAKKYEKINKIEVPHLKESYEETIKFRNFKVAGVKGLLNCNIKSIIIPLLADHILRETNYYLTLFNYYKNS